MRVGKNPFKGEAGSDKAYRPRRVTVCLLVYIPNFEGYYRQRFDILKISIASLVNNTEGEFDLLVFDNGSCGQVIEYLRELQEKEIVNYLLLSKWNLGYNGALNFIFSSAPGDIIAYADDDVFYHPGWLKSCVAVLETFPNVGYVTGCPVKNNLGQYDSVTQAFAKSRMANIRESSWDTDWDEIHCNSLGSDINDWKSKYGDFQIPVLEYQGVEALPVSTHFQYVFKKEISQTFLPFQYGHLMSSEPKDPQFNMLMQLDKRLNDSGLLKLATNGLFTEHLGNVISSRCRKLIELYGLDVELPANQNHNWITRTIYGTLSLPFIKKIFYLLYRFSFKVVHWKLIRKIK